MIKAPKWLSEGIAPFAQMFTKPTWSLAQTLMVGLMLAPGKRTVTAVLAILGLANESGFLRYHRVLSRARWSPLQGGRILLRELVQRFAPTGPLFIGVDDSIERRRGKKICAKGIYRDPVRSSHGHFVKVSGLRWQSLMLLVPIPFAKCIWALPFLTALVPSERYWQSQGKPHRTLSHTAYFLLRLIQRWYPERQIIVMADGAYAIIRWLTDLKKGNPITVITRVRLDIVLHEAPPEHPPGKRGRPRVKGERLPSLSSRLDDPWAGWASTKITNWYGEKDRIIEYCTGLGLWHRRKGESVYGRWAVLRDPLGLFQPQALFCTDETVGAVDMLTWFPRRWRVEVTFEESRAHLGVETGRGWSALTIERTTPVLLGMFSVVTLLAQRLYEQGELTIRTTAWYDKPTPTFSDALATIRRALWRWPLFEKSRLSRDSVKIPRHVFDRMSDALCYAA